MDLSRTKNFGSPNDLTRKNPAAQVQLGLMKMGLSVPTRVQDMTLPMLLEGAETTNGGEAWNHGECRGENFGKGAEYFGLMINGADKWVMNWSKLFQFSFIMNWNFFCSDTKQTRKMFNDFQSHVNMNLYEFHPSYNSSHTLLTAIELALSEEYAEKKAMV